ncbi:MAG: acylneuraminate cytidylyltransferase, partial [Bacteroidota bacterium]
RNAELIDEVYLNTESEQLGRFGEDLGINYLKRPEALAADDIVLDQLTNFFLEQVDADIIGMVNPVCPLTTSEDIDNAIRYYRENDCDTLIAARCEQLHAFMGDRPLNFDTSKMIPMTQDLEPVKLVSWNFCFWNPQVFRKSFAEKGCGVFSGKVALFPVDKLKAIKISEESDFQIASAIMKSKEQDGGIEFFKIPK